MFDAGACFARSIDGIYVTIICGRFWSRIGDGCVDGGLYRTSYGGRRYFTTKCQTSCSCGCEDGPSEMQ